MTTLDLYTDTKQKEVKRFVFLRLLVSRIRMLNFQVTVRVSLSVLKHGVLACCFPQKMMSNHRMRCIHENVEFALFEMN